MERNQKMSASATLRHARARIIRQQKQQLAKAQTIRHNFLRPLTTKLGHSPDPHDILFAIMKVEAKVRFHAKSFSLVDSI